MHTPSDQPPSQEHHRQEFFTLAQAAALLHLTDEEFAEFWFQKPGTKVFMTLHGHPPIASGFYAPAELLGMYRPSVRLLCDEITSISPDEVETFLKRRPETQTTDAPKTTSGRIRDAFKRLL